MYNTKNECVVNFFTQLIFFLLKKERKTQVFLLFENYMKYLNLLL